MQYSGVVDNRAIASHLRDLDCSGREDVRDGSTRSGERWTVRHSWRAKFQSDLFLNGKHEVRPAGQWLHLSPHTSPPVAVHVIRSQLFYP